MGDKSAIEWTDATWNPITGCTKISAGCDNCYAARFAERWRGTPGHPFGAGFDLTLRPERLEQPLRWKRPRRIFVNSMSDLFHRDVPTYFIDDVFAIMERAHWHQYQVLTKRPEIMRRHMQRRYSVSKLAPPHVWLGVSVEEAKVKRRIDVLRMTPARVRFLSVEPLIGPLGVLDLSGIGWVIVGGESGPGARRMHPDWVREIRDQCMAANVPFFFKQWGGIRPKANGRELDGREWNGMPLGYAEFTGAA
jgi:protein gp37